MHSRNKFGIHAVGKNVLSPQLRDSFIKPLDVGHTTAENDYVWIDDVDDMRKPPRQSVLIPAEAGFGGLIIFCCEPNDVRTFEGLSCNLMKIPSEARTR